MKSTMLAALIGSTAMLTGGAVAQTAQPGADANRQNQNAAQAQAQQGQAQAPRPMATSDLEDRNVFTQQGRRIGTVDNVVRGRDRQVYAVVAYDDAFGADAETALIPMSSVAGQGNRLIARNLSDAQIRAMPAYSANAGYTDLPDTERVQVTFLAGNADQSAQADGADIQADGADITVRQAAPAVRVQQSQPQVTVRQPQPRVTVRQNNPQIIVRQGPPTITVEQPQPEIIVRMPEPDVNVAMAQPQVQVRQPPPQVQVVRPDQQAQVSVERQQANVRVQQAQGEAQVALQRGQPQVQFERTGEPKVVYRQAEGQPRIMYERMTEEDVNRQQAQQTPANRQQAAQAQQGQPANAAARQAQMSTQQREQLMNRFNDGDVEATGAVDTAAVPTRPVGIGDLEDMDVYNARGQEIGEVDRVIVTPQGRHFVVVASGGFLGLGEDTVAFPMERFWMRGDNLVIRGVTENDIEAMDDYRDQINSFQRMGATDRADLRVWQ